LKDWGFSFVVDLFIMAMIKLKELIDERYVYHVTAKKNLPSIKSQGILPSALTPVDIGDKPAVFLFKDKIEMEDAVGNWLGDKFDEDEPLVCLTINAQD
jgi:hypothetical protein